MINYCMRRRIICRRRLRRVRMMAAIKLPEKIMNNMGAGGMYAATEDPLNMVRDINITLITERATNQNTGSINAFLVSVGVIDQMVEK